jgi:acyl-CoA reductase-like NAD-dependent aldehyde dehydrogenase
MLHQVIETLNARVAMRPRYDNFIGGKWVAPVDGQYFDNISPITGKPVCQIARSQAAGMPTSSTIGSTPSSSSTSCRGAVTASPSRRLKACASSLGAASSPTKRLTLLARA